MSKKVLVSGASGDTGRAAIREAIALGLDVRAMVHGRDARSELLETLGAEVVLGDLLEIDTVRAGMEGVDAAYFVWPVAPGLIHATVNFARQQRKPAFRPSSTCRSARPTASPPAIPAAIASSPNRC
jgi:NAD(P)H dehydrogenase (quinone)